jgi:replicative DNA helicase
MSDDTPHNIELEQQILGGLLYDNTQVRHVVELPRDAFFDPVHRDIFDRIVARIADDEEANYVTMRFEAASIPGLSDLGGSEYLVKLQSSAIALSQMPDYLRELRRLYGRRTAIIALDGARARLAFHDRDMTPEKVLEMAEGDIAMALQAVQDKPLALSWLNSAHVAMEGMLAAREGGKPIGISTGIDQLDGLIGAMGAGEYIVVAGRPSMGKTAVALNIALKSAARGEGVFFASLEMGGDQLAMRSFSQMVAERGRKATYFDMRRGRVEGEDWDATLSAAAEVAEMPIYTCDPSARSLTRLRAALAASERQLKAKGSALKLIVVDYLQLVEPTGRYRPGDANGKVTAASQAMKAMAMHYGVPVMVLSQLSRQVEMRDPPVPQLSDLRDSGSIEQDADLVIFCYRPEYYTQKKIDAQKGAGKSVSEMVDLEAAMSVHRNKMTLICAKNRGGATGSVSVYCDIASNVVGQKPQTEMDLEGEFS